MIEAILQHVTQIPLPIRWMAQHTRLGQHESRQRGSGMDFDQIKEYQQGETVRKVNWAATARKGSLTPLVNAYYEERDLSVILVVDLSASMDFGSTRLTKRSLAAEICASLVYSALASHDRVGLLGFASDVVCYLPPRHTWNYQRAIPQHILTAQAGTGAVNFWAVVESVEKWIKHRSLMFLLSDFLTDNTAEIGQALTQLRRKHDLITLLVNDPLEHHLPTAHARLVTCDLETGHLTFYSFTRKNQRSMEARRRSREAELGQMFGKLGLPHLTVTPTSNYTEELAQLMTCHRRATA
jgi:uncharacterized protein (DUF58 family)